MNTAVLGLGSNINPESNIANALEFLKDKYTVLKESQFVQTTPIGDIAQDDFINGSLLIETSLSQTELKKQLLANETQLGRKRTSPKAGPRTIDIDIVIWNSKIVDPDFYDRDFLQTATLELLPDLKF